MLVTENAVDFRGLVSREELHPGLIILPNIGSAQSAALLLAAIAYLEGLGDPMYVMVNQVLEVALDGGMQLYTMPG